MRVLYTQRNVVQDSSSPWYIKPSSGRLKLCRPELLAPIMNQSKLWHLDYYFVTLATGPCYLKHFRMPRALDLQICILEFEIVRSDRRVSL